MQSLCPFWNNLLFPLINPQFYAPKFSLLLLFHSLFLLGSLTCFKAFPLYRDGSHICFFNSVLSFGSACLTLNLYLDVPLSLQIYQVYHLLPLNQFLFQAQVCIFTAILAFSYPDLKVHKCVDSFFFIYLYSSHSFAHQMLSQCSLHI